MPIPSSQLETWSHQGAVTTSSNSYRSIERALQASSAAAEVRGADIFLQGSYSNSTNIYGDSDVDVVVMHRGSFHRDLSRLTAEEQQLHSQVYSPATYVWKDLHADVLAALRAQFGYGAVTPSNKAIEVDTGHGRLTADVVPALQFRKYATFKGVDDMTAHWGIQFFDSSGHAIINYPKYHIARGEDKNTVARTGGHYKLTVRAFKNFRNYLYDEGLLADGIAPSYFLECMLHTVPDSLYRGDLDEAVPAILTHLSQTSPVGLLCQNGVVPLIGADSTQWSEPNYEAFVGAAIDAWNN